MSQHLPGLPGPRHEPTTAGYWLAAGEGRLVVQRCGHCGVHRHPPTEVCYECNDLDWRWEEHNGRGSVYSYTWTDSPVLPALAELGPYNVTVVELEDTVGVVRILSRIIDVEREELVVGLAVEVDFDRVDDETALPVFRPRNTEVSS